MGVSFEALKLYRLRKNSLRRFCITLFGCVKKIKAAGLGAKARFKDVRKNFQLVAHTLDVAWKNVVVKEKGQDGDYHFGAFSGH